MEQMVVALNVLYADKGGNIAFWRPGEIPARPDGYDIFLPLSGDGSAEWTDETFPIPRSINPTRGWLANWNNKATVDDQTDALPTSKQSRVVDIEARLVGGGPFSRADMLDIAKDISRTTPGSGGKNSRFLNHICSTRSTWRHRCIHWGNQPAPYSRPGTGACTTTRSPAPRWRRDK
jgi:hypothetical protein